MAFRAATTVARERILSFGSADTGKSFDYYAIARMAAKTGSDAMFYIVDTDVSVGRMLSDPQLTTLLSDEGEPLNVIAEDVHDWDSLIKTVKEFQATMRPQDWLMIDMLSPTWQWVQDAFTNKIFNKGLDEYFLQKRAEMRSKKDGGAFEGWVDWPVINSMYGVLQQLVLRSPGNLYCTAEVKAINNDQTERDIRVMFGPYGVVPVGQKRNPHLFSTIIHKRQLKAGEREGLVVKDRGRPDSEGSCIEVKDFALNYLVKYAGWKLA